MQIVLDATALSAALGAIGGAVTTGAVCWTWVVKPLRRTLSTIRLMSEDWHGEPGRPGVPGRDGVMVRLANLEQSGARVESRVHAVDLNLQAHVASHIAFQRAGNPGSGPNGPAEVSG